MSRTADATEVRWMLQSTEMHGTLVAPSGSGPVPAVVMVAGSGPTDRDWKSPLLPGTNGSARLLADALAAQGIASLRYDKIAVTPNANASIAAIPGGISMRSHRDELAGAVRTLARDARVRADRIFALTNSEGALHALNYQLEAPAIPFTGLVLTGAPGRAVGAVARTQLAAQASGLPDGERLLALYDAAIERWAAGASMAPDPALPQGVQQLLQALDSPINLPFARELWLADGAALLERVRVPVLVIIGKKDIQVDWRLDGEPLERAAAGRADVTFVYPENANHVLKHEPRPREALNAGDVMQRYNAESEMLDAEVVGAIVQWLRAHG